MDIGLAPVKDPAQLVPIGDLLERQGFHRRASDDQSVKPKRANIFPVDIEGEEMVRRCIAGNVIAHLDQGQFDLKRACTEQASKLGFCPDFVGHQIEQTDPQRAHILADCIGFAHHHHAFLFKRGNGGQIVRNPDRHCNAVLIQRGRTGQTQRCDRSPIGCRPGHILPFRGAPPCPGRQVGVGRLAQLLM